MSISGDAGRIQDDELMELAAKAVGGFEYVQNMGWIAVDASGNRGAWWYPLESDADALRLAASLKMCISITDDVAVCAYERGPWVMEPFGNDMAASYRRAIVRAAAAVGTRTAIRL